MSLKQLPLSVTLKQLLRGEGDRLLALVRDTIALEVKQNDDFAQLVGVKPSQLSAALHDNGYNFALRWVPAVLHIDQRRRVLSHMAALCGARVIDNEISDAEYRQRMEEALRRAGAAGEAIRRDALSGDEP